MTIDLKSHRDRRTFDKESPKNLGFVVGKALIKYISQWTIAQLNYASTHSSL